MDWYLFIAFLVVSSTSLLPYNLFMNAHRYFYFKLRNVTFSDNSTVSLLNKDELDIETTLQREFEGFLTIFGGVACIVGAAINLLFTNRFSNTSRVIVGHVMVILSFLPTIMYTYIDTDDGQTMFFYISLLLSSVASFGSMGLIGGGIMGLASTYPAVYMQTVMLGQSIAGIFSSVLSILCQAFASDDVINGRIYFVIALFWTVASVFFYAYLVVVSRRRNCVGHYTRVDSSVSDDERARLQEAEDDDVINEEATPPESGGGKGQYGMVLKQARLDMLCVFLVLLITLSGFPALSSQVKSTSKNTTWTAYFSAICCFLVFNVGDSLGRLFGNAVHISRHSLLYVCLFRLVFIPLIALCNVEPRYNTVTLLPYDGFFLLVMILFALTQGFTMTQSTVNVGRSVDESLREVSGSMINLACVASALTGSLVGAVIVDLV